MVDEAGPSCASAAHVPMYHHDCEGLSRQDRLSIAKIQELLAQEQAELERERVHRLEAERSSEALAQQIHEQEIREREMQQMQHHSCEQMHSCLCAVQPTAQASLCVHHSLHTHPSAPAPPVNQAQAGSSLGGGSLLPDAIPVLVSSLSTFRGSISPDIPHPNESGVAGPSGSPIDLCNSPIPHAGHGASSYAGAGRSDVDDYQLQIQQQLLKRQQEIAESERLARQLQETASKEDEEAKQQSLRDEEMARQIAEEMQREEEARAARDEEMAKEAQAAEHQAAEERKQEEELKMMQGLEAARKAQEEEEKKEREKRAALEAQAVQNEHVAQLLDAVSQATQQDVADLDRAAIIADEEADPEFQCPIMFMEYNKKEEGAVIGQWSKHMCNHWVSKEAMVQYICQEAEEQRFRMRCPVCAATPCDRCEANNGCCYIPSRQIRSLLNEEQMTRLLFLQEQWYRTANKDKIVQCPHPDCQFFYALEEEDIGANGENDEEQPHGAGAAGDDEGQAGEKKRWREGRDMWCDVCQVRYCLHCTEAMGTLVRWHDGKTCKEFMQEAENAKAAAERKRLEKIANEGHEKNRGKTWQRCPRCGYEAWKADGQCNRVVCKEHCGCHFCFLCGEDITRERYKHYEKADHQCHLKVWHLPLGGVDGAAPCRCAACRRT